MKQETGSKLGKDDVKAVYCHSAYLTYMQSTSCRVQSTSWLDEEQARIKFARRNINNLQYADDTTLMAESEEEIKSPLMKLKEGSEKVVLNSAFKKLKSWHQVSSLHGKLLDRWGNNGKSDRLYFGGLQNHCRG